MSRCRGLPRHVALLVIAAAAVAAYWNSLKAGFVFDDVPAIVDNPHVRSVMPLSRSLTSPPEVPTAGRPFASLTFAVNYEQGGGAPWWFHSLRDGARAVALSTP